MTDLPAPVRFANYPGDQRHIVGEVKGPNLFGEALTATTAEFDPTYDQPGHEGRGTTRVGFAIGVHQ